MAGGAPEQTANLRADTGTGGADRVVVAGAVCAAIDWFRINDYCWGSVGVYSLRGKGISGDPTRVTTGNFLRGMVFAVLLSVLFINSANLDAVGVGYAIVSGAVASGMGYALWYSVLPVLKGTTAATVQLSVPVIAALGGILFLGEALTLRFVLASMAILGGIALVILKKT
ncbi:DMT family transporter [Thiothrix nivea]|uniref:DMT family transporter n=1 Tax=Thiothrix nivea TaxID=1031 RepID=UPI0002D42977|nr:DMT family transporter [Thiothrix nivea]